MIRKVALMAMGTILVMTGLVSAFAPSICQAVIASDTEGGGTQAIDDNIGQQPCEGDFDVDNDVDGSDLAIFAADFGRTSCATAPVCEGDFDCDCDVDCSDLALFASDFGRTDCALINYKVHGLNFSPYMDSQDPNKNPDVSEYQLQCRMRIINPYTKWIRTFGCAHGLEESGRIAHELSLKAAVGAWLSDDIQANESEIQNLISATRNGHVDIAVMGSEVLLRGDLTEAQLLGYIQQFKDAVPEVPVTTAEVYSVLLDHPNLMDACDIIFVNYHPYWEGKDVQCALSRVHCVHQDVVANARGKEVIVSETGWPSDGDQIGHAVPSLENACFYFLNFVSWARANDVKHFYFEAFDEQWKALYEGPQGAHWGMWDKHGILKPCMHEVFEGETLPDNWTIPGGPGDPAIEFTHVPPYGSADNLRGQVWHAQPDDYRIAVYIYVNGGWWTKPYWDSPLTVINCDGSWECDITTGGVDPTATRIVAYFVPYGYDPPLASGQPFLPPELESNSVAKVEVTRTP